MNTFCYAAKLIDWRGPRPQTRRGLEETRITRCVSRERVYLFFFFFFCVFFFLHVSRFNSKLAPFKISSEATVSLKRGLSIAARAKSATPTRVGKRLSRFVPPPFALSCLCAGTLRMQLIRQKGYSQLAGWQSVRKLPTPAERVPLGAATENQRRIFSADAL